MKCQLSLSMYIYIYIYIYILREEKVRRPRQEFSSIVERRSPLLWCRRRRVFRDLDSGTKTKKKNEESVDVFTNSVKNEEQTFSLCTFSHYSVNTLFPVRVRSCRQEISVVFLLCCLRRRVLLDLDSGTKTKKERKKSEENKTKKETERERPGPRRYVPSFLSACCFFSGVFRTTLLFLFEKMYVLCAIILYLLSSSLFCIVCGFYVF